ncbi:CASP-like protein 2C1 [Primulina eburnea]|uniref:CASP-like protein 2C1 n=1 Tax=Primulina eburnea TaxID=1245227 RepID=UPI003C6BDCBD
MGTMNIIMSRKEILLRTGAIVFLVLTSCLMGFNHQTKLLFNVVTKKATFRDLNALFVLVWIDTAAAAYNMMQLLFRGYFMCGSNKDLSRTSYLYLTWGFYILDQAVVYMVFAAASSAVQGSMLAVTGEKRFVWMKLCDKFTRFCFQIGGGLVCGFFAIFLMAIISFISAFNLFRLYSPKQFLLPKPKGHGIY